MLHKSIKFTYLLFIFVFAITPVFAQNKQDPAAKKLLDQLSEKTKSYKNLYIDFKLSFDNDEENIHQVNEGNLLTQHEMYILNILGRKIISDGKTIWTILTEDEEVQISDVSEDDEMNFTRMLTIYEKGFDYQMGEKVDRTQNIKLFPQDKESAVHQILLTIDLDKMQIVSLVEMGKNGTNTSYTINNFRSDFDKETQFSFNESEYPDFDVIDMR